MKKYKIAFITDHQRYLGFRLASQSNIFYVPNDEECKKMVKKLFTDQNYGLILVSSSLYNHEDTEMKNFGKKTFPLLVEIPVSDENLSAYDETKIIEILRKSIGYSIKF
jgi:vacuolar-type H+-ATPase subunit F/Vma7